MNIYEGNENYIFVSYAHADSDRVMPILEALDREGLRLWYDSGIEVGSEWPAYIAARVKGCYRMIYFVTENSVSSKNCRNEVNLALSKNKEIIVAYLEDAELQYGLDLQLSTNQAIYKSKCSDDNAFISAIIRADMLQSCRFKTGKLLDICADINTNDAYDLCVKGVDLYNTGEYEQAFLCFQKSAELDYDNGQSWLAFCYETGKGVEKDMDRAVSFYLKLARKGHVFSQLKVAWFYQKGISLDKDCVKSVYWYQKAAEQGNPDAQTNLGWCYEWGWGVLQDYSIAAYWYQKAVEQGHNLAQINLNKLKSKGLI